MKNEKWMSIPNYEGSYIISNFGLVRSLDRTIEKKDGTLQKIKGRQLKYQKDKDGYIKYTLCDKNKAKKFSAHRLVMYAFVGISDLFVNHINGIKSDNRLENLEYCTNRENVDHKIKTLQKKEIYGIRLLPSGKWQARIAKDNKKFSLGTYKTKEEAFSVYCDCYFKLNKELSHED